MEGGGQLGEGAAAADEAAAFIASLMAAPACWHSIWFLKSPSLISGGVAQVDAVDGGAGLHADLQLARGDRVAHAVGLERPEAAAPEVGGQAAAVLAGLRAGALDVDRLARATRLPAAEVAAALVELELAGLVSGADGLFRVTL